MPCLYLHICFLKLNMAKEPGKKPSEPVDHELGFVPSQPGVVDNINSNKNNGPNYHDVSEINQSV